MKKISKDMFIGILVAIVFFILGVIMIYWANYFYNDIKSLRQQGIKTEGTILRYKRIKGPKPNETMSVPIVKFQTQNGKTIIGEGTVDNVAILQNICYSGEQVEIIYDPQNPKHAVINTFAELWFAPLLLWTIGIVFIFGPSFTIWKYYQEKQQRIPHL